MLKKCLSIALFAAAVTSTFAQIEPKDSTFQVIGYWSKGEKQSYNVSESKIKLNKADTTSKELMTYQLDITVLDSTDKNYRMEWAYSNYTTTDNSQIVKDIIKAGAGLKVIVLTNENGEFVAIENWKEIQAFQNKMIAELQKKYASVPEMKKLLETLKEKFSTKEQIEANTSQEVGQFLSFHGGKYKLGEVLTGKSKQPSLLGKPLDNEYEIYLDEINFDDNNGVFRMSQTVDSTQLTDQTYEFLKKTMPSLAKSMSRKDMPSVTNTIQLASRIHNAGWVIYSIETKTTNSMDVMNIEERVIDLK